MSAEYITIEGRFKDPNGRYEELQQKLIEGFKEIGLEIDEDWGETWDDQFRIKDGYLDFSVRDCIGRIGNSLNIIDNGFIETYPEILLELFYTINYYDFKEGEKVSYDGKEMKRTGHYINIEEIDDEEIDEDCEAWEKLDELFYKDIGFKLVV